MLRISKVAGPFTPPCERLHVTVMFDLAFWMKLLSESASQNHNDRIYHCHASSLLHSLAPFLR